MATFDIRDQVSKAAARAIQNTCTYLGYVCAFSGEIACFAYGGTRPPTNIEVVVLLPGVKKNERPTPDTIKRLLVSIPTGFTGTFSITEPGASPVVLSFSHSGVSGKWKTMIIEIIVASELDELDVQPMCPVDGIQYASPEYVLSSRLSLWLRAHNAIKQTNATKETQTMHRNREIDPLLTYLANAGLTITKWRQLGVTRILKYCRTYPTSSPLWFKIGLNPDWKESAIVTATPASSAPTPLPAQASTSVPAPPPYEPLPSSSSTRFAPSPSQIGTATPAASSASSSSAPKVDTPQLPGAASPSEESVANPSRIQMIMLAASRAVTILQTTGMSTAIFGSLACFMYGNTRSPNDVDILVLPPGDNDLDVEEIKLVLALHDSEHFFLLPARDPEAGYKILYYRLTSAEPSPTPLTSCKVDLVLAGTLSLPNLPRSMINWDEGLPLIPFSLLLLQKLQGWDHHRRSAEKLKVLKQRTDVEDLKGMFELDIVESELRKGRPWEDERVFTGGFLEASVVRVRELCTEYPVMREDWRGVGFGI